MVKEYSKQTLVAGYADLMGSDEGREGQAEREGKCDVNALLNYWLCASVGG